MRRRHLLTAGVVATSVSLAGCTGFAEDLNDYLTGEPAERADVSGRYATVRTDDGVRYVVRGDVRNLAETVLDELLVVVRLWDVDGEVLHEASTEVTGVPAGESRPFEFEFTVGVDVHERVDGVSLDGEFPD